MPGDACADGGVRGAALEWVGGMKRRLKSFRLRGASLTLSLLAAPAGAIAALICNPIGVTLATAVAPMAALALLRQSGSLE
jgi:hypothetical protein